MATQTHEWVRAGDDEMAGTSATEPAHLFLWAEDGYLGHYTELRYREHVPAALADYGTGYEGNRGEEITVRWSLWQAGEKIGRGTHTFVTR